MFSKSIKNSVQVKTFNMLSIKLDSIYAELQETDFFLPLPPKNTVQNDIGQSSNK